MELFRALVPAIAAESGAFSASTSVSFESLAEAEQLLTAYLRVSRVGLCVLDSDFRYVAINRTMAEMNNISVEAHLAKSVREVLGDFADLVEPHFKNVLATQQPILNLEISAELPTRDEPCHWIQHCIPVKGAAGDIAQIGVAAFEVTEQKKLEESLRSISETLHDQKKRQHVMTEVSNVLSKKLDVQQAFPKISAHLRRVFRQ